MRIKAWGTYGWLPGVEHAQHVGGHALMIMQPMMNIYIYKKSEHTNCTYKILNSLQINSNDIQVIITRIYNTHIVIQEYL